MSTIMQPTRFLICQMAVQCDITAELTLFSVQVTSDCCQLIRIHTKICKKDGRNKLHLSTERGNYCHAMYDMSVVSKIVKIPRN